MPDQDTRVKQAAAKLASLWISKVEADDSLILNLAEQILRAADYEAPKWPADASADALGYKRGADLSQLREAMLADPIIRAAIALRQWHDLNGQEPIAALTRVVDAVRAAGL